MSACRSRLHQEQVLQQKIQSRKLEKIEEEKNLKQASRTSPLRVGSAKRYGKTETVSIFVWGEVWTHSTNIIILLKIAHENVAKVGKLNHFMGGHGGGGSFHFSLPNLACVSMK